MTYQVIINTKGEFSSFNPIPQGYRIHDTDIIIDAKSRLKDELTIPYCSTCIYHKTHKIPSSDMQKGLEKKIKIKSEIDQINLITTQGHMAIKIETSQIISIEKRNFNKEGPLTRIHCRRYFNKDFLNY